MPAYTQRDLDAIYGPIRPLGQRIDTGLDEPESNEILGSALASIERDRAPKPPGFASRALHTLTLPFVAPQMARDWLGRKVARGLGLPVGDDVTLGQMARSAAGLDPQSLVAERRDSVPARLLGRTIELGADIGPDLPLPLGLTGKAARVATGALGAAAGMGALEEGKRAVETIRREGFTPQAAEEVFGTTVQAGMAGLAGAHALSPVKPLGSRISVEGAEAQPIEAPSRALVTREPTGFEMGREVVTPEVIPPRRALPPVGLPEPPIDVEARQVSPTLSAAAQVAKRAGSPGGAQRLLRAMEPPPPPPRPPALPPGLGQIEVPDIQIPPKPEAPVRPAVALEQGSQALPPPEVAPVEQGQQPAIAMAPQVEAVAPPSLETARAAGRPFPEPPPQAELPPEPAIRTFGELPPPVQRPFEVAPRAIEEPIPVPEVPQGRVPLQIEEPPPPVEVPRPTDEGTALARAQMEAELGPVPEQPPIADKPTVPGMYDYQASVQRATDKRGRVRWEKVAEPPLDPRGNRILPGEEVLTPIQRAQRQQAVDAYVADAENMAGAKSVALDDQGRPVATRQLSAKDGGPFEGMAETPSEMRAALRKDKGNPLELELRRKAAEFAEVERAEMGPVSMTETLRQAEPSGLSSYGEEYRESTMESLAALYDRRVNEGVEPVQVRPGVTSVPGPLEGSVILRSGPAHAQITTRGVDVAGPPGSFASGRLMRHLVEEAIEGRLKNVEGIPMSDDTIRIIENVLKREGVPVEAIQPGIDMAGVRDTLRARRTERAGPRGVPEAPSADQRAVGRGVRPAGEGGGGEALPAGVRVAGDALVPAATEVAERGPGSVSERRPATGEPSPRVVPPFRGPTERTPLGEQSLIPGTLDAVASGPRRPTEAREAEGPLFTQEREAAARATEAAEARAQRSIFFDGDAALARLKERGKGQAFDLGSVAGEGFGAFKDLAELGASHVERAFRQGGAVPKFGEWVKGFVSEVGESVKGLGPYLRQLYDQAVALFRSRTETRGRAAAAEARGPEPVAAAGAGGAQPPQPPKGPRPIRPIPDQPRPPETPTEQARAGAGGATEGKPPDLPFNLDRMNISAEEKAAFSRAVESMDPAVKQAQKKLTFEEMRQGAFKYLGLKSDAELQRAARDGMLGTPEGQYAVRTRLQEKRVEADRAFENWQKVKDEGGEVSDKARDKYLAANLDFANFVLAAKGAQADAARALASYRILSAPRTEAEILISKLFKERGGLSNAQVDQITRTARETPELLPDAVRNILKPKLKDKALELWKAGLLSGPPTQVANIIGNAIKQGLTLAETAFTARVTEPFLAKTQGRPVERFSGEAGASWAAVRKEAPAAMHDLFKDLQDIVKLKPEKLDVTSRQKAEYQVGAIEGKKGRFVRIPFRALDAFDTFFKRLAGEQELYRQALRQAHNRPRPAGTTIEQAAQQVIDEFRADPDSARFANMRSEIERMKLQETFQDDPGSVARMLMTAAQRNKALQVIFPFIRTPARILAATVERTPYGLLRAVQKVRSGELKGAQGAEAITKGLLGTAIGGAFAAAAQAGFMTGSGPTDPKDQQILRQTGWQPYSFVLPDGMGGVQYLAYNRFEPLSSILGMAADLAELKDEKKAGDLLSKIGGSVIDNLTNKTYLRGMEDVALLLSDPNRYAASYMKSLGGSLVPNIIAKAAQAIDPAIRDTRPSESGLSGIPEAVGKAIAARVPGLSKTLPERRSGTGEPMVRSGTAIERFLSPVQRSTGKDDVLERELIDIDAVPPAASRTVTVPNTGGKKVSLTDDELRIYQDFDQKVTERLRKMVKQPGWARLDPEYRKRRVEDEYRRAAQAARSRVMPLVIRRFREERKAQ